MTKIFKSLKRLLQKLYALVIECWKKKKGLLRLQDLRKKEKDFNGTK